MRGAPAVGTDTVSFQVVDGEGNAVSMVRLGRASL
jgi:gamma-glutamyltranspeptidase